MAVIEIARIQVRRGKESQTGIPQLDSGELGWAEDTEHLYIGKRIVDGAKDDNNTRILTENDLINVFSMIAPGSAVSSTSSYRYRDNLSDAAFPSVSAISGNNGTRPYITMGTKLDQAVSLVDLVPFWPPTGNDITSVTNAALQDLYANTFTNMQRTLKIPAGSYIISDTLKLPPETKLVGEGKNLTQLVLINDSVNLMQTVDKLGHTFNSMTNNQAVNPANIHVEGMTLAFNTGVTSNMSLISLDNVRNASIKSVDFKTLGTQFTDTFTLSKSITLDATERAGSAINLLKIGSTKLGTLSEDAVYYLTGNNGYLNRYAKIIGTTSSGGYVFATTTSSFGFMDFTTLSEQFSLYMYEGAGTGVSVRSQYSGSGTNYNSNNIANSENIQISDSVFDGLINCVVGSSATNKITVTDSVLKNSLAGIRFYNNSTSTTSNGPIDCQIKNNKFVDIYEQAIYVGKNSNGVPSHVISSENYFTEVGNDVGQVLSGIRDSNVSLPAFPVIEFKSSGNLSMNDFFNRREVNPVYYNPIAKGMANIQDPTPRSVDIPGDSLTGVLNFPVTGDEQYIEVKYQMTNKTLSRKGTVALNIRAGTLITATNFSSVSDTYVYTEEQSEYSASTSKMKAADGSTYDTLYVTPQDTAVLSSLTLRGINGGNSTLYITGNDDFAGLAAYVISITSITSSTFALITQSANPQFNYDKTVYPMEEWTLLTADTPVFSTLGHSDTNCIALNCDTSSSTPDTSFKIEYQINSFQQ
jgi:hypothetical protein